MTADAATSRPRHGAKAFWALLLGAALLFGGFLALGCWQLQRLAWKQDLIARVTQRLATAPAALPGPATWAAIDKASDEYRRLTLRGRFDHQRETLVRASTALGSGYWVMTPLRVEPADGPAFWLLVNRGFVPPEERDAFARPASEQALEGLLRLSELGGSLLQHNEPAAGRWYSRDVAAIAAARGLSGPLAPYFADAWPEPAHGTTQWPHPGLTVLQFSNNHRVYALTWFALAAMVAGAALYLLHERRRITFDLDPASND